MTIPKAVFIKANNPWLERVCAEQFALGHTVYIQFACINCQGRGWFGRAEAPWMHRNCDDCAGVGFKAIPYAPPMPPITGHPS